MHDQCSSDQDITLSVSPAPGTSMPSAVFAGVSFMQDRTQSMFSLSSQRPFVRELDVYDKCTLPLVHSTKNKSCTGLLLKKVSLPCH